MSSRNYIWVFDSSSLLKNDSPLSLEYHVQSKLLTDQLAQDLIGSRVWLVMKSGYTYLLYGVICPEQIERYTEGKYKNDYLLVSNPYQAIRFLPRVESVNNWSIVLPEVVTNSIVACDPEVLQTIKDRIVQNSKVSFAPVPNSILDIVRTSALNSTEFMVPDQLCVTLRAIAFGDIHRPNSSPAGLSAIGSIAIEKLRLAHPDIDMDAAVALMRQLDPLSSDKTEVIKELSRQRLAIETLPPVVDTVLEDIDVDKISPRVFVAHTDLSSNDWLEKTSRAEENHEAILKDVVIQLQSRGYKTKKSRSFDLVAEKGPQRYLFEIKSATSSNLVSQGEQAVIQLLRYSCAISNFGESNTLSICALINKVDSPRVYDYLFKMTEKAGFELWLYDNAVEWPNRALRYVDKRSL